jgi:hypothetical protein
MVKHDPKQLENILSKIEKPVKGEVKEPIVQEVNNIAGEYLKKMIDAGIDVEERKNYITHLYNEVAKEFIGYQPGKTNLESKLYATKQRKIETYEQAKEYGFTPKYSQVRQIIAHYVRAAERKIAQQKYINDMVEKGLFVKGDMLEGKKQFKQVYGTEYFAVKDIANIANKIFDPQSEWKWLKGLANLSTAAQDVFLSGGGLGTPLNAYYLALLNKELLGGNIKGAGVASIKSLTEKKANKYFLIPENMKTIKEIQLGDKDTEGMAVETTLDIESLGDKPGAFLSAWKTLTKTLTGNIRGDEGALKQFQDTWAKVVNEPTFKRALPIMNIEFYKMVKKELLGKGLSETEATNIALKTYKNWTGNESMLALALQDKNWQNFLTSVLFAKVYRRTMGKFFLNNVSALKSPNKPENKRNLLFLAAFILTAALADLINKKGTGVHIWQNKGNTKDKLVIPYNDKKDVVAIPVFNSLWTIPKTIFGVAAGLMQGDTTKAFQSVQSATSMLLNPLISIANNKNWYGEEIYDKSDSAEVRYEKIGKYLATQYNHPYIQAYMDNQAGKKTGVATVSQALELPFRFYTDKQLNTAEYYSIRDEVVNKLPPDLRDTYNKIHQKDRTDITDEDGLYVYNIHDAMGDASDKLANPEIMKADEEIARKMAKRTGQEVNPFYDLEDWQQEKVLMLRTFYPGDEEKTKQTNANKEWLQPYWDKSAEYTKNLIETGAFKDTNTEKVPSKFDKPTPSKELQSKLDFYNTLPKGTGARSNFLKSNPDVLDYFNKNSAITELQREALGLTPKEDTGYGGGSGFNYKLYYALKDIMKSYTDKKDLNKSLATLMAKKPKVKSIINEVTKTKKINIYRPLDDIMKEYQTKLFGKKKL